jgi:hypothetical protein
VRVGEGKPAILRNLFHSFPFTAELAAPERPSQLLTVFSQFKTVAIAYYERNKETLLLL